MPDDNINRSDLVVDFKDVYGATITDKVEIKIYNTQLLSLKQIFNVNFQGSPVRLQGVPAFPTGHAQMIITPMKYRFKQRFINVEAGVTNNITEYFFVDPARGNPSPIEYADVTAKSYREDLLRILKTSEINEAAWETLDKRNRALASPFTTVDIGVGYRVDRWELRLDGRNLGDARDPISESELGDAQYYRLPARRFDFTVGVRF